ncbi:UL51 [Suid alphaherpesvirus 1]|nr:UL51 [Suid alphaherpesvirus 1]
MLGGIFSGWCGRRGRGRAYEPPDELRLRESLAVLNVILPAPLAAEDVMASAEAARRLARADTLARTYQACQRNLECLARHEASGDDGLDAVVAAHAANARRLAGHVPGGAHSTCTSPVGAVRRGHGRPRRAGPAHDRREQRGDVRRGRPGADAGTGPAAAAGARPGRARRGGPARPRPARPARRRGAGPADPARGGGGCGGGGRRGWRGPPRGGRGPAAAPARPRQDAPAREEEGPEAGRGLQDVDGERGERERARAKRRDEGRPRRRGRRPPGVFFSFQ